MLAVVSVDATGCESSQLPAKLADILRERMTYIHLHALRGWEAYDPVTGETQSVRPERRNMYLFDRYGRFCCGLGFLDFVSQAAKDLHLAVDVVWTKGWHDHPNPKRFTVDRSVLERADLRYRQPELLQVFAQHNCATFDAPPGIGKTFSLSLVPQLFPYARIHIISEGVDILGTIQRQLQESGVDAGMVGGGQRRFCRTTVVSVDSAKYCDPTDRTSFKGADIVIVDEAHKLLTDRYVTVLRAYQHARKFGLSATLEDRFDGADAKCEAIFGPVRFQMSTEEATDNGLVTPIIFESIGYQVSEEYKAKIAKLKQRQALDRHGIYHNPFRNQAIADRLAEFGDDVQVLVLVTRVEHAMALKEYLPGYRVVYDPASMPPARYHEYVRQGLFDPTAEPLMTGQRRKHLREQFAERKLMHVIATDVWSTSVNFESLQVVVMAAGEWGSAKDFQGPGRAMRLYKGKEYGLVLDPDDRYDPRLMKRAQSRRKNYRRRGWKAVTAGTQASTW